MLNSTIVLIVILQAIICAALSSKVASKKGYSGGDWGSVGFFFGILGLIAAAGLPVNSSEGEPEPFPRKTCPSCYELVKFEARKCKYCGNTLSEEEIIANLVNIVAGGGFLAEKATKRLVEISPEGISVQLIGLIEQKSPGRRYAILALGELNATEAIPTLTALLLHEHTGIVSAVGETLSKLGDESAVPELIEVIDRGNLPSKKIASQIIVDLGPASLPFLKNALSDSNKDMEKRINKLIKQIEKKV